LALVDVAAGAIQMRFVTDTWRFLSDIESALTRAISNFYGMDLDADCLQLHASVFPDLLKQNQMGVNTSGDLVVILKSNSAI
jgi:hypothetical protein